ncbi:periplasmic binding protein [Candidatus Vecturithrix granuli]|uniref:Periplasmic binding protein n=1 Tax=Vecturithrix granuli TaxID=1499967 RepID=A0A081BZA4_VECG1|nr:periplasmic binding protein [Candidatus Vecturithrix granuli]
MAHKKGIKHPFLMSHPCSSPQQILMRKIIIVSMLVVIVLFMSGATCLHAQQIIVTDALERQINFETPPQRIVVTGKAFFMITDALYLFPAAADRIAATGIFQQGAQSFIAMLDPKAAEKAVFAPNAGAEQIAAFQPDAVILKSYLAESLGTTLDVLGIPVVYVDLETPEQYLRDLRIIGDLFGQPERAEELVEYYQHGVEEIQTALHDLAATQTPRVLLLNYSNKDGVTAFQVPPLNWIQTRLVELAGGEPVWRESNPGKGWSTVTLEQISAWDADVILIVSYFKNLTEVLREIKADQTWNAVRAVQTNHLYAFPGDLNIWDQPNPRWILGLTWLAQKLHSERFADVDIIAVTQEFYQKLYNLDTAFFETHLRPMLQGDLQ